MHYNCLIIDDETDLAKMTCEYFQAFDVSCAYVGNAGQCLAFLKGHTVDLLLLNINLQEESGFTLCKTIREESDIPILFISARQSDDDILIALNIGGDDYIKKPYTLSVLLEKVKVILKRLEGSMRKENEKQDHAILSCGKLRLEEETLRVYSEDRAGEADCRGVALIILIFPNVHLQFVLYVLQ